MGYLSYSQKTGVGGSQNAESEEREAGAQRGSGAQMVRSLCRVGPYLCCGFAQQVQESGSKWSEPEGGAIEAKVEKEGSGNMKVDDENMAGGMDNVPVGLDGSGPSGVGELL